MNELMRFKSHIEGKNADVTIHPDRIEWALEGRMGTKSKLALGVATGGMSLLKTGVSGKTQGTETIPIKSISSVTTKRDGIRFTAVSVIVSGNTIDFRVGHSEADAVKSLLTSLVLGSHPSQQAPPAVAAPASAVAAPSAPTAAPSVIDQLKQLGELRDAGVLTDEEFAAQKASVLGGSQPPTPTHDHLPPPPTGPAGGEQP